MALRAERLILALGSPVRAALLRAGAKALALGGAGVQLFSRINGDHFAVLGLPLIELLEFLRGRGAVSA